ncbi:sensor histidine kinase [Zunongwangia endophytica]|uniref:histidine kinase n=1 Tax=Zunongwangia endophytica TaxID=1808945 RepID=A0ABV8H9R5_9FLAO|nr:7TM diverse intracellular signaling domain-containing protein [Zunongwangia endophytica]MDN3594926.1 7TM diverse intracellular signaling domain-containing protein [Zunongwangia endophytica]
MLTFASGDDTLFVKGAYPEHIVDFLKSYKSCSEISEEALINAFEKGEFKDMPANRVVNRGFTKCQHYFALTVKNDQNTTEDYFWSYYNDGVLFILYEYKDGKLDQIGKTSAAKRIKKRAIPIRCLSFQIEMKPYETKTLILKTELQGHANLYFPTDFTTAKDIYIYETNHAFLMGRYFGYFIFTALFNLLLYIIIRRKLYGFMFGYILSMIAFNSVEYMYDTLLVPDFLHFFWVRFPKMFFALFATYFHTKVFQYFTNQKTNFPKWFKILKYVNNFILFILLLFVASKIILPENNAIFDQYRLLLHICFILNLSALVVSLIHSIVKGNKQAIYYMCCNILLILSLIFFTTNTLQLGGSTIYMAPGNIINSVSFEILSLTIAFLLNYRKELRAMNAKIIQAKRKSEELSTALIKVQENERNIIARNLHDGLGNTMNALRLLLESRSDNKKQIDGVFDLAQIQFKNLIFQISPKNIESVGLFKTIQQDLKLLENTNIEINLTVLGKDECIGTIKAVNIYRIFQELMSNIIKHAKATVIDIVINCDEKTCSLQLEDNGIGLKSKFTKGMGIKNIKSRVSYHQGIFHMENTELGMISIIEIPLEK